MNYDAPDADYSRGELDASDIADLKRDAAAERKAANHYCPECECHGYHATGCPETPDDEDED